MQIRTLVDRMAGRRVEGKREGGVMGSMEPFALESVALGTEVVSRV